MAKRSAVDAALDAVHVASPSRRLDVDEPSQEPVLTSDQRRECSRALAQMLLLACRQRMEQQVARDAVRQERIRLAQQPPKGMHTQAQKKGTGSGAKHPCQAQQQEAGACSSAPATAPAPPRKTVMPAAIMCFNGVPLKSAASHIAIAYHIFRQQRRARGEYEHAREPKPQPAVATAAAAAHAALAAAATAREAALAKVTPLQAQSLSPRPPPPPHPPTLEPLPAVPPPPSPPPAAHAPAAHAALVPPSQPPTSHPPLLPTACALDDARTGSSTPSGAGDLREATADPSDSPGTPPAQLFFG